MAILRPGENLIFCRDPLKWISFGKFLRESSVLNCFYPNKIDPPFLECEKIENSCSLSNLKVRKIKIMAKINKNEEVFESIGVNLNDYQILQNLNSVLIRCANSNEIEVMCKNGSFYEKNGKLIELNQFCESGDNNVLLLENENYENPKFNYEISSENKIVFSKELSFSGAIHEGFALLGYLILLCAQ
ncbi:hypothetical protein MHBO_001725 [Bonamia ostreae]|uniref:Uncharacterized protein n=1 Tax=Bonamia ostreae TaxID=126728 RepID=A0ABV2AK42_9EUKA